MPTLLVTGANRGLGLEFTRQYLAEGWEVIAACRNPGVARALKDLAAHPPGALRVTEIDVADTASVKRAAAALKGHRIDVLINGAGIFGGTGQGIGSLDYDDWMEVLETNLLGPARMCEAFLEQVARSERRIMLTITSGMGSLADNTSGGYMLYRTSKAAVNMVMRTAAIDLQSRGITCVVVNPGWVKTDMGGSNAKLTPEQSVSAMRRLIGKLTRADSGRFYNYDGREFPW
ncbi:MAG: SDR family oxidoreductase [Gammaproteobacteria bacterium]|nr:SDR family oxidoreductase [Gammaproteobacteria bacterium]